jgi:hypothetical protein
LSELTVQVFGYGAEVGHIKVSEEAYTWWKKTNEEDEYALVSYLQATEEDEYEGPEIPKGADFLGDKEYGKLYWADSSELIDQYWQTTTDHARVEIEVDGKSVFAEDDTSPFFLDVVVDDMDDNDNKDITMSYNSNELAYNSFKKAKYIITFESVEKGCFIDSTVKLDDKFDKSKLVFHTEEDWDGNNTISGVDYDGEDLEDIGGDSNGKGIYAYVWKSGE